MTLRDYRLTAAARTWGRAQLQADPPRRRGWLARHTTRIIRRARRTGTRSRP